MVKESLDFIFVIYSCKKNLDTKSNLLFHLINDKLPKCKCYIVYGDDTISTEYEIIQNKYLILNCGDYYEHLSQKTIALLNVMEKIHPKVKGIFKCDDDILPNTSKLNELFAYILSNNPEYLGCDIKKENDSYENYHRDKVHDPKYNDKQMIYYRCNYVTGPLYYLSIHSIRTFNANISEFIKDKDITEYFPEDNIVGYILNSQNIFPVYYKTYYDHISEYFYGSIQNIDNRIRHLFMHIHGGLGNQLFQVAAAYEMANKYDMHVVLVYKDDFQRYLTHNTHRDEFLSTIFKSFNSIHIQHIDFSNVITYNESRCFDYDDNIIQQYSNYYIEGGYFQNKKYLRNYKTDLIFLFRNPIICSALTKKYLILDDSYFIHVRRGDYVYNPMYSFDSDSYFINAINYIMNKENNLHVHFFIVSDDIEYCKRNFVFHNIPRKTFIDDNLTTLESLYLMSLCKKGGICSNSTFSGWATNLNTNPEKTVVVPKQWIHIDYPYEIPFDYTIAL
jgi:hypothetical protein